MSFLYCSKKKEKKRKEKEEKKRIKASNIAFCDLSLVDLPSWNDYDNVT